MEHLIWLEDGRFGKNVALMYAMKNVSDIKSATSKASIYVKNNEAEAQKCLDDFRDRYRNAPNEKERQLFLGSNAKAYQRSLQGSPAFWNAEQKKCQAIMDNQAQPFNLFYTVSNAEAYDHVVDEVLSENLGVPPTIGSTKSFNNQRKRRNANENPLIVAKLYQLRVDALRRFMNRFLGVEVYMDRDEMQELRAMVHTHGVGLIPDCPDFEMLLSVLYDHRAESQTAEWFEMKKRVESLIEDWVKDLEIIASTSGVKPPQGKYDRSECLTLDIVLILDDEDATDDCVVKLIHRVLLHKHHSGYCYKQIDIPVREPKTDNKLSRKRSRTDTFNKNDDDDDDDDDAAADLDDVLVNEDEGGKGGSICTADKKSRASTSSRDQSSSRTLPSGQDNDPFCGMDVDVDTSGDHKSGFNKSDTMAAPDDEAVEVTDEQTTLFVSDKGRNKRRRVREPQEGDGVCRFDLPQIPQPRTTVTLSEKGNFVVRVKRDEGYEMMIPSNKEFILTTQSNHCMVIVLNRNKCSDYIMKYSFKSEKTKKKTDEMLRKLLQNDALSAMQVTRKMFMEFLGRDQGPCAISMAAAGMALTHTSAQFRTLSFESKDVLLTEEGKVSTQGAYCMYLQRPIGLVTTSFHTFVRCFNIKSYAMLAEDDWMTPVCYSFHSVYNPRKEVTHEHWCKCICKMHFPYPAGVKELLPTHLGGEGVTTWTQAFQFFLSTEHVPAYVSRGMTYYNRKISGRLYRRQDDPAFDQDACIDDQAGNYNDDDDDDDDDTDDNDDSDDDDDDEEDSEGKRLPNKQRRIKSNLFGLSDSNRGLKVSNADKDRMLNSFSGATRLRKDNTYDDNDEDIDDAGAVSFSAQFGDGAEDDNTDQDAAMQKLQTSKAQKDIEAATRVMWPQSVMDVLDWEHSVIESHSNVRQEIGIDAEKTLNESQQKVFDYHQRLLEARGDNEEPTNGSVSIINGVAGVGKTVLVNHISTLYNEFYCPGGVASENLLVVGIIAPTATAATLISGTTIHNFCQCGVGEYQDLEGNELQIFQHKWRNLKVLFGDERGMWGKKILATLLRRIMQLFPERQHLIFGGINLILAGDNGQLGPVKDNVIWLRDPQKDQTFKKGKNSKFSAVETCNNQLATAFYAAIDKVFFLTKVERVVDPTVFDHLEDSILINKAIAQEKEFQEMLPEVRNGMISRSAFELLKTRTTAAQTSTDLVNFRKDAVNIVLSNKVANERNMEGLQRGASLPGSKGFVKVSSVHVGGDASTRKAAERVSGKDSGGIENTIVFVEDSPVLYRRNLCVGAKLVNGSSGKFKAIVRDITNQDYVDGNLTEAPVLFVIVEFPRYVGPPFSSRDGEEKYVPVLFKEGDVLIKKKSPDGNKKLLWDRITRRGLPLMLAYAITVHRCQGMTIYRGILDLEKKEFCAGLTFTALSRFASLFHFLIESTCFYEKRFEGLRSIHMMFRIAEDARLLLLSEPDNPEYKQSWEDAINVAVNSKPSTIKWRIPDGGMQRTKSPRAMAPPPANSSRSRTSKPGKMKLNVDEDNSEDDDYDDDEVTDDQYQKQLVTTKSRNETNRLLREQVANEKRLEIAATFAASKEVIFVPDSPLLSATSASYEKKRWCLQDDGKTFMRQLQHDIALHRYDHTSDDTMYQDEHCTNMVSFHQMGIFFCQAYIYGSAIDYFLVSSLRYKNVSVRTHSAEMESIPDLVNNHEFPLSTSLVTYLPTDFYMSLAGDSTYVRANNYDYQKCQDGGYTRQYLDSQYLLNDIVSVIHRWFQKIKI